VSIQEPSNDHEAKIQAAILRSNLQDCFEETSNDCNNKCKDFDYIEDDGTGFLGWPQSGSGEPEGHQVIRSSAEKWRKESWDCVEDGFWSLFKLTNELERDSDKSAAAAEAQTWGIIDEFFQWTATDKSNTGKFREWQDRALGRVNNVSPSSVMQMINDECNKPEATSFLEANLYTSLRRDFLRLFERRLEKLRYMASQSAPVNPSGTNSAPQPDVGEPGAEDPDLRSRDKKKRGIARARFVARVKKELDNIRPDLFSAKDIDKLAEKHSDYVVFKICANRGDLREALADLQIHKQYLWLAIRIAAAKLSKSEARISDEWQDYKDSL
jgi:hypothetical protein